MQHDVHPLATLKNNSELARDAKFTIRQYQSPSIMPTTITVKTLPTELIIGIYKSLDSLASAARLARASSFFNDIWKQHGSSISLALLAHEKRLEAGPFDFRENALKVAKTEFKLEGIPDSGKAANGILLARRVFENALLVDLIADDLNDFIWAVTRGFTKLYFVHPGIDWKNPKHTKFCIVAGIYALWAESGGGKRSTSIDFRHITTDEDSAEVGLRLHGGEERSVQLPESCAWISRHLLPELYRATRKEGDPDLLGF
ncbi:hypothetical protein FN846DRAFT_948128 [Sphaerosporella brunnea]|uniref:F-box domain-containing protein n=1 Tax=Sphaerosporella brunnea TaxID=1250544 RepID=A0A5J5EXD3_9PEZI|nr:hypothetical protein FN846DRAFT_948128 [Sphaerosporella brunnea]